jgi:very-short-patch-repair endonuclease
LRRNRPSAEEILWACLRNHRLIGAKFRRQHPLGRYIADFYCHEARLAIELQGGIHNQTDQREYDAIREEVIEQLGIKILHFTNDEVKQNWKMPC